jgi:2-methylcitrate dehydratase PrpD
MNQTSMDATPASPTATLAAHAVALQYGAIPFETRETAKRLLLDGIGCMLAGTRGQPARMAYEMVKDLGGAGGPSTLAISGDRATARDAAFVNGITLYSVGVNDIHKPSGAHPGGCVVPAVLALGEALRAPGREMLAAMVAGYDVMGRLGRAVIPSHRDRGFHPTGTFGPFGATAACGRLAGLDAARMRSALGIAGSQAAGLKAFQTDGSLTMIFHAGRSAQNGVEAAMLARHGFSGPHTVFEDRQGFVRATTDVFRMEALTDGLGVDFEVNATSFRPYYGCTLTITASGASALIAQRQRERGPADIASVHVRCSSAAAEEVGNPAPQTLLAARLSMEFNVALVLTRGQVVVADVSEEELRAGEIQAMLPKIHVEGDESFARYASEVTVTYKDGTVDRQASSEPKGDPQTPMTWDDTVTKFMRLAEPLGDARGAQAIAERVQRIEESNGAALMQAIVQVARHGHAH